MYSIGNKRITVAIGALCAAVFLLATDARAETTPADSSPLQSALQDVKTSVNALAQTKDTATPEEKTQKEFKARAAALQKIINLGRLELENLRGRLESVKVEELVAYDYAFDAADAEATLTQLLDNGLAYYDEVQTRLASVADNAAAKRIAAEIRLWREQFYNPVFKRVIAVQFVLHTRDAIKTANNRFEKIVTDLRKLKSSELVRFNELEPLLTPAAAGIKKAEALNNESATLLLKILKEPLIPEKSTDVVPDYDRITNLAEQSLNEIRRTYKKFIELNSAVKTMLNIE